MLKDMCMCEQAVESLKREVIPGQPLTSLANRPLRATPPLQESDPWFVTLKQVWPYCDGMP